MKRLFLFLALCAAGCSQRDDDGPVAVGVIGGTPLVVDPSQQPLSFGSATLLGATAQGLVRFDGAGQIEPGLAIRWDVSDDGLYYTFRIADGLSVNAEDAARWLRAAIGPTSRNPLKPVLGAIEEIVAVTPQVIEIRLRAPRPNLLQLLAQPELAIIGRDAGTGPFRAGPPSHGVLTLTPTVEPAEDADEDDVSRAQVRLRPERAALAVARFAGGDSALVLGGRFADLPVARAASLPPRTLRFDPVAGLFGLAIVDNRGFLGSAEGRRALSMAIDRTRLAQIFGLQSWAPQSALVPPGLADLPTTATPDWIDTPIARRRAIARDAVARWTADKGAPPLLRAALPAGPGARLLFAMLRRQWGAIGVAIVAVPFNADADLRLVDQVAPADIASWYLRRFSCDRSVVCSEEADTLLIAAREAPSLAERTARLAEADARFAEITPFIPIAMPLRWSLVSPRLRAWRENARGIHPLNHLRDPER